MKYEWIDIMTIMDFRKFEREVNRVLESFGKEYMISFV